ncbi:hypothetical protein GDI0734 [Gluconacetobacter diazotrophicus PA1 5]|uniref:Uncharacterized protein n=1 Tax=Gluconacetobacter diazotrophicus (strain ATCC 49037 / DSM 5601 / CCUG 37298 / CIP 103539 / LMG 7603 / PAl5) TaxID=272568 RepID=A9HAD8_GLUDA|nr:hypothetical protein GDI0734 [Gluconacetobacter diazotrophicus PA1 5]
MARTAPSCHRLRRPDGCFFTRPGRPGGLQPNETPDAGRLVWR